MGPNLTGLIDIHSHVVPDGYPALPCNCCAAAWPHIRHQDEGKAMVMIGDKAFRPIESRCWDPSPRLAEMDAQGVAIQVLSPMPELLSHWIDTPTCSAIAHHTNAFIGRMVAANPDRFAGLGMVPMQDPQLAARELSRLKFDHGLVGIEVGSNIDGRSPGDAHFDVVWAEAARLNLCVFVHALRPTATDRLVGPVAPLSNFVNFPIETALAAASFITGDVLTRIPGLRVAFSHGGGALASILPRLSKGWAIAPELRPAFADPAATARSFFYDNLVFDAGLLKQLIQLVGITQVVAGSDYPFIAGQTHPGRPFDDMDLSDGDRAALAHGNANRFLYGPLATKVQ